MQNCPRRAATRGVHSAIMTGIRGCTLSQDGRYVQQTRKASGDPETSGQIPRAPKITEELRFFGSQSAPRPRTADSKICDSFLLRKHHKNIKKWQTPQTSARALEGSAPSVIRARAPKGSALRTHVARAPKGSALLARAPKGSAPSAIRARAPKGSALRTHVARAPKGSALLARAPEGSAPSAFRARAPREVFAGGSGSRGKRNRGFEGSRARGFEGRGVERSMDGRFGGRGVRGIEG